MADVTITGLVAVLAAALDDTAVLPVDNNAAVTKKATVAQLRTQILSGLSGAVTSKAELTKAVTAIADATATDVLTITVPNAAHSALVRVMLAGSLGAGGAIGANEATGVVAYDIAIARTAGVNAVAGISAAYGAASAVVAGGATITVTAAMSAVVGAVGASNSFTVKVTITKGSGASANHTCRIHATVVNANATGVSVS
jgi:hypothetical protein